MKFLASAGRLFKDAKRENLLGYKGLFRSATAACEPKSSTALLIAFNLAVQIGEKFDALYEHDFFFFFFFLKQLFKFIEISHPV